MYGPTYSPAEEKLRLLYVRFVERQDSALQLRAVMLGVSMAQRLYLDRANARQIRRSRYLAEYTQRLHTKRMAKLMHQDPAAYLDALEDLSEVSDGLTIPARLSPRFITGGFSKVHYPPIDQIRLSINPNQC